MRPPYLRHHGGNVIQVGCDHAPWWAMMLSHPRVVLSWLRVRASVGFLSAPRADREILRALDGPTSDICMSK